MARPSSGSAITVETAATPSNTTTVSATTQTMRRMPSPRHSRLPQAKRAHFGRRGQYRMDRTGHFSSHRNEARNVPGTGRGEPTDAGPVVVPAGDGPSLPRSTQMALARMRPATGRAGTARSWPAWTVLALSIGLWTASVALGRAHGPLAGVPVFDVVDVVIYTAFLAWTVVGAVIVSRRPSNRIGWLLCAAGLLILLGAFALHYALATLLGGWPSLPGGGAAAWPSCRDRNPEASSSSGRSRTRSGGRPPGRSCGRSTRWPRWSPPPCSAPPPSRSSCGSDGPAASSVNSSNGWPTRPFCSPATTSLPSCTRGGRSAASPR